MGSELTASNQRNSSHVRPEFIARHNRWADAEMEELLQPSTSRVIAGDFSGTMVQRKRALRGMYYRLSLFVRPTLLFLYSLLHPAGVSGWHTKLGVFGAPEFLVPLLVDAKLFERRHVLRQQQDS